MNGNRGELIGKCAGRRGETLWIGGGDRGSETVCRSEFAIRVESRAANGSERDWIWRAERLKTQSTERDNASFPLIVLSFFEERLPRTELSVEHGHEHR